MELKKEMAEAIVNDMLIDDGNMAQCISCGSFGDFPGNVNHTSSCIVLRAKSFLLETEGD